MKNSKMHIQPRSKALRMMNIYQIQTMEKFNTKPKYTALMSSEPWTGAATGLTVTLGTPHTLWGGELPTTVLGMHLLRTQIFPRNFSFSEQHRTHQVLGVLLCVSSQGPEGPARLMGFLLTSQGMPPDAQSAGEKGRHPYSKEYNLKRV